MEPLKDAEAYGPAYDLSHTGGAGPQCSGSADFCFFCQFAGGGGGVGDLKGLVTSLAADGKEVPFIAEQVQRAYDEGVRNTVVWSRPEGDDVDEPEWTIEAITRHLLYSNEFSRLFDSAVDQIFHSVIHNLNNAAVDRTTGIVAEEHLRPLLATIKEYRAWREHRGRKAVKK